MSRDGSSGKPREREVLVVADDRRVRRALAELVASIETLRPRDLGGTEAVDPADLAAVAVLCDLDCAADGVVAKLVAAGAKVIAIGLSPSLGRSALAAGATAFVDKGDGPDAIAGALRRVAGRLS